jgi:ADP-ribose pyrophosphatase YjhB (NUDIX family)
VAKPFYTSGFLYNIKNHQILLVSTEQPEGKPTSWSMLGGEGKEDEEPKTAFKRVVKEVLNLDLKDKDIFPIYDYFHSGRAKDNHVFYAEVKTSPKFKPLKDGLPTWVSFLETLKFLFSTQTKQDVVVGQRVINLKWRIAQNIQ